GEKVRRVQEKGITNLAGNRSGFVQRNSRPVLWLWDVQLTQQVAKPLAVFGKVDGIGRCSDDRHSAMLQIQSQIERRLSPELHNDSIRLFFADNVENVLERERLEVEAIGCVVVGRHRLRIAVNHDRLKPFVLPTQS